MDGQKEEKGQDRVEEAEPEVDRVPLKHLNYRAAVNGAFARSRCIQEFGNNAQVPLEAIYTFPMPGDSSVTGCKLQIGERKIEAELKEREEARKEYDQAVQDGHHASLLEQERENIFEMNVGGIEPGEEIKATVDIVQRITWQAGGGRFTLPMVVAPRFIPGKPTGKEGTGWADDTDEVPDASKITPPVAKEGVPYLADISIMFSPGFRCELESPSHGALVQKRVVEKDETVEIKLTEIRPDRDFIICYRSLSDVPEVAVHTGAFNDEEFLLASIIPPGKVTPVGTDIVGVLDCSGSMGWNTTVKIDGEKMVAKRIAGNLAAEKVGHRMAVLPFRNASYLGREPVLEMSPVGEQTEEFIAGLGASGGTDLGPALKFAERMFPDPTRPRVILLITDGDTESGVTWNGNGIRLIAAGIDTAVNDALLRNLAKANKGVCEWVYPGEDYEAIARRMTGYLSGPVLLEVSVQTDGDVVGLTDVFEGRPATIAVRFKGEAKPILVKGVDPLGKPQEWQVSADGAKECDFAAQIFARDWLREHPEKDDQLKASLQYGIICRHTSFVAVSIKEVPGQAPVRVPVEVNLPQGWDYDAVFGEKSADVMFVSLGGMPRVRRLTADPGIKRFAGGGARSFGLFGGHDDGFEHLVDARIGGSLDDDLDLDGLLERTRGGGKEKSTRFTLDSGDVVDRLVAVLIEITEGDRMEAERVFAQIQGELTLDKASGLSELDRARAYYFALRLSGFGLRLSGEVIEALGREPSTTEAIAWYNLAKKEVGKGYHAKVEGDHPDVSYLGWKFGVTGQPDSGDYAAVP